MVTSPIAALNETVGDRGVMINGDWLDPVCQNNFASAVVFSMSNTDHDDYRKALHDHAVKNFGWDSLADQWNLMLHDLVDVVKKEVMPPYMGTT
jgi:hypothetical protein